MARHPAPPLSEEDRREVVRLATDALPKRYPDAVRRGMNDSDLAEALETVLGIFGGSGRPGRLSVTFAGSGLRIWGGWHSVNHVTDKPLVAGRATLALVRDIYGIADPDNPQGVLL